MRLLARLPLLVAALAAVAPPALAATPKATFALKTLEAGKRGYYVYEGQPGAVISGHVRVVNAGNAPGTASLAAVDATTGATTGAVYEQAGTAMDDVGAWVTLETHRVTLAPGASADVGFTVTIPQDARSGDHLGGIVAAPTAPQETTGGAKGKRSFHVNVVEQSVVAVQVGLPGAARAKLAVRGVKAGGNTGYQTLVLALSNPGERMVKGLGTVTVTDRGGKTVGRQRFAIDTFLPRTRIDYPLVVRGKALLPGDYRATVTLDWGSGRVTTPLRFSVSRKDIKQAFGPDGVARLPGESSGDGGGSGVGLMIAAAVLALLLGFASAVFWFRRQARRIEERIAARMGAPPDEPRFEHDQDRESSPR